MLSQAVAAPAMVACASGAALAQSSLSPNASPPPKTVTTAPMPAAAAPGMKAALDVHAALKMLREM
jgi:hypothetical protein